MESLGVILRVTKPTPWCAGMVDIPKKFGSVRINKLPFGISSASKYFHREMSNILAGILHGSTVPY